MELKDFVSKTIIDICAGIKKAQEQGKSFGACIAPGMNQGFAVGREDCANTPQMLEFDVAVTVNEKANEESEANAGAGISVISAFLFMKGREKRAKEESSNYVSRIKFTIPVLYPVVIAENLQYDFHQDQEKRYDEFYWKG